MIPASIYPKEPKTTEQATIKRLYDEIYQTLGTQMLMKSPKDEDDLNAILNHAAQTLRNYEILLMNTTTIGK